MTKKYNILWIDDEFEDLVDFDIDAENNDILLDGFKSFEEAFVNFESRINSYEGVLLDGMFFEKSDQVNGSEDERGIAKAIYKLATFEYKKKLPWFVLSGKKEFTKEENKILIGHEKQCFDKTNIRDHVKLFKAIKIESDKLDSTQLKHEYDKAFEVFWMNIIDSKYEYILFELLVCLRDKKYKKKNLNIVRDLLEAMFLSLITRYDCIPIEFLNENGQPVLEWCKRYFANQEVIAVRQRFERIPYEIPKSISWSISYIKEISSGFSHLSEEAIVKNSFIAAAHAMLEVLEWLPKFIKENSIQRK